MKKISIITVQNIEISVATENNVDYICLTDMVKGQEGEDHIRNWMRNRNTLEFLGAWEMLHNPTFKGVEFDTFLHEAGANRFNMTPRKWIEATGAIGMTSKAGRNGGTYAHKDIAFEFGSWLSPVFKLYLITEYQRLKEAENAPMLGEWNVKRVLSKVNYTLNAELLKRDMDKSKRYSCLREMAERQLTRLNAIDAEKGFRKLEAKNSIMKKK